MNLDEVQRKQVAGWIAEGLKLSDIQNRLASDLGVRMTYMEVRLLVDDLKLTPKDVEPAKPVQGVLAGAPTALTKTDRDAAAPHAAAEPPKTRAAGRTASLAVSVDTLARFGAVVSGKVTFTDGNVADWYIDQTGRLGLAPQQAGYRPPPADLQQFQLTLESELSKLGF